MTRPPFCAEIAGAPGAGESGSAGRGEGGGAGRGAREANFSCYFPGEPCLRLSVCGDGQLDPGEGCDDGGTKAGDGCDERCLVEIFDCLKPTDCPESECPNGKHEPGEECDEGPNGFVYGIGCMDDCRRAPYCGDGVLNGVEECDLGLAQNRALYGVSGCSLTCTLPHRCGDARLDGLFDEQCDDGAANGTSGSSCTRECLLIPR